LIQGCNGITYPLYFKVQYIYFMMEKTYRLTISCPDGVGIVAAVSQFLADHGGWISEANHHSDPITKHFFMRQEILADSLTCSIETLRTAFIPIAEKFAMDWQLVDASQPKKVVLCVSKQAHCLNDLLYRWRSKELFFDIPCVISNHEDFRDYVEWHGIPFHHIPVTKDNKQQAFANMAKVVDAVQADVVVLARYMQIFPPDLCEKYANKIINIHHSFLPSFVGARPYHQASERGVKLIGATCHYVTEELDAGPIIEQDVLRVNHGDTARDMVRLGRDVEKMVLSRGLRYHLEDRVLIHDRKTVVLS